MILSYTQATRINFNISSVHNICKWFMYCIYNIWTHTFCRWYKPFPLTQKNKISFFCSFCFDLFCFLFVFSIWIFFHKYSQITGLQGKGEGISLTPHYHFHPLHRHLDISRVITPESSPLHIASSRDRAGNLWCPSASG